MNDRNQTRTCRGSWAGVILLAVTLIALASACAREPSEPEKEPEGLWSKLTEKATDAVTEAPRLLVQRAIDETESLLETVSEDYAPVLREAGFEISQVRITLGVPPGLAFRVKRLETVSEAKQEEILDSHRDDETLIAILHTLFAMNRFDAKGYDLHEIMVHSDLPPRVTMILVPAFAE